MIQPAIHIKVFILLSLLWISGKTFSQCMVTVNTFPYQEGFEISNGGWTTGGSASDWAWGIPAKSVIGAAGQGQKAWVVGGLSGNSYADAEASWLQSPCFDFTSLNYPYLEFLVFWEMEYQFDGASLQYSLDNGSSWQTLGAASDPVNCLNTNWYNISNITYLAPISSNRNGWSGNIQPTAGSCRGGNGSNGWVTAKKTAPELGGEPAVIFRFIFGSGTICNNFNGFAIDNFRVSEAPVNQAAFSYTCINDTADFKNESALCPTSFSWDFGDPASGASNLASGPNPQHIFSGPGTYTVTLTVDGPGNAPSTTTREITILDLITEVLQPADCISASGGFATVTVNGGTAPFTYSWNTSPIQNTPTATGLGPFTYQVSVGAMNACSARAAVLIPTDPSCTEVYFPNGFTPDQNGINDGFGPLGNLGGISDYRFRVYNRWGEIVFQSKNPFEKWDGNFKGSRSDGNVFVWRAEYKWKGEVIQRKGTVLLIR